MKRAERKHVYTNGLPSSEEDAVEFKIEKGGIGVP